MTVIDGSFGEGGGQILRTSLALSLVTGRPFRMENIRAGREKPGLLRQHLAAVEAAAAVSGAAVRGNSIGSGRIEFEPGEVKGGEYRFAVGTAGSATLVFQSVLPALMLASEPSSVTLEGGTHNPWAPPFDFMQKVFLPALERMGPKVTLNLERCGFFPAGGGCFHARVEPAVKIERIDILERGQIKRRSVRALVACLPEHIGAREVDTVREKLGIDASDSSVSSVPSRGPGNVLIIEIESEGAMELVTGYGRRGVAAEEVAKEAVKEARGYLASGAPVGRHLADQLLIPMAIAGGGSFRTCAPTEHTRTNAEVIGRFLDIGVEIVQAGEFAWQVDVATRR